MVHDLCPTHSRLDDASAPPSELVESNWQAILRLEGALDTPWAITTGSKMHLQYPDTVDLQGPCDPAKLLFSDNGAFFCGRRPGFHPQMTMSHVASSGGVWIVGRPNFIAPTLSKTVNPMQIVRT